MLSAILKTTENIEVVDKEGDREEWKKSKS